MSSLFVDEVTAYILNGSRKITPKSVSGFRGRLPGIHFKMASIKAPEFPHLVAQIEFLARFAEDCADGVWNEAPYVTFAEALFALSYLLKDVDVIPDTLPDIGFADDSEIIRTVLARSESVFKRYAEANNLDWSAVTLDP